MRHLVLALFLLAGASPAGTAPPAAGAPVEFEPSSRLPADEAIAFPVDI